MLLELVYVSMLLEMCTRHTPVQRIPGLCSRGKAAWRGVYRPPTSGADVKERVVISLLPLHGLFCSNSSTLTDNMTIYVIMYVPVCMYCQNVGMYIYIYIYIYIYMYICTYEMLCMCVEYAYAFYIHVTVQNNKFLCNETN